MVTALVVVAVGFVGVVLGHSRASATSTITVTGSGTVQGTPDTINFQIGVSTVNPTATAALTENDSKVRALEAALLKNGVTKRRCRPPDSTSMTTPTTRAWSPVHRPRYVECDDA